MNLEILSKIKNRDNGNGVAEAIHQNISMPLIDYDLAGYTDAGQHLGDISSLRLKFEDLYNKFLHKIEKNEINREKEYEGKKSRAEKLAKENARHKDEIDNIEKVLIPENAGKVKTLKKETDEITASPEKQPSQKEKNISHYVGVILLASLTAYLWVFYSSAGYSSFFRQIVFTEVNVLNSVFYPKALTEAYGQGFTAILFTVLIPSVFLALGYLIHKFAEIKKMWAYTAIGVLTIVTFLFDFIIAYEISKKLYDALAANSFVDKPEYSLKDAFTDVNVYMIIFAGFVVYIVWGILFHFVTESFGSLDKIKVEVNKRKELIKEAGEQKNTLKSKINELQKKIDENENEISSLQYNKKKYTYNFNELEKILTQYAGGWNKYLIGAKKSQIETDNVSQELQNILEKIKSEAFRKGDYENE